MTFVLWRIPVWGLLIWRGVADGGSDGCHGRGTESLTKLSFYSAHPVIMATFFGEVLSVYSRAVEEDDEDLDENEEDEQIRRELEEKR